MWRKIFDVFFWVGTSLYFGGLLTLGIVVAPAIFKTSREAPLSMPGIASPPLDAPRQVTGEIFGNVLNRFTNIELIALALMLAGLGGWIITHIRIRRSTWMILVLWTALAALTGYDAGHLRPKVFQLRDAIRAQAPSHAGDAPNAPWPERAEFDALHIHATNIGKIKSGLLLAILFLAAWRTFGDRPAPTRENLRAALSSTQKKVNAPVA